MLSRRRDASSKGSFALPALAFLYYSLATCVPATAQELAVGPSDSGGHVVPTLQLIRPAGETVSFGGRPVDLMLSPDAETLYVKDNRGLVVLDVGSWSVRQELPFGRGLGGSMHGIAVTRDGLHVYATTAQNVLMEAEVDAAGELTWSRRIALAGPGGENDASHATGIALDEARGVAYVCLSRNNVLAVVDLETGNLKSEIAVGIAPFDVVLSADRKRGYVSNWGGRHPTAGERTASSSGTEALIDERGVGASGTVSVIDLETHKVIEHIETGLHPSDLALDESGNRLYVANANSDTITVIDTTRLTSLRAIDVRPDESLPFGSMPNALALSSDASRLYFANAGNNAVGIVDLSDDGDYTVKGFIPAGWFPGAVVTDKGTLYIANVKGIGSRNKRSDNARWGVYWHMGTVSKVNIPSKARLADYTAQVNRDARIPQALRAWERRSGAVDPVPVPKQIGDPSVFEHVVYIIKENRTYDQVFGDLAQGNGDPDLCIYPREITPNHHALAEQFVLLDNYYCNGINSADGHAWSTEGNVTDHLEKSFGGFTRSYTFGNDPLTYSSSGFIWDNVLLTGLSFRNYGEFNYAQPIPNSLSFLDVYHDFASGERSVKFTQNIGIARLRQFSSPDYPGWNMKIPDVRRADIFLTELKEFEENGSLPNLTILYLPQDHTTGTTPGAPTPRAHLADNDLALGRIVEGVSTSRFWSKTCIFVIEDDPQDGFDHVDGHRSICLVISPYTKRGAVVSDFYNQTSVLHTMARMLGVPPMNQMDSMSPVMETCFTAQADTRPYTALANTVPLDETNPDKTALSGDALLWAQKSLAEPFDLFDEADEDTLNRILWHAAKGSETPYPAQFAGAHGRGLKALDLALDEHASED